jgi:hypothetical protein
MLNLQMKDWQLEREELVDKFKHLSSFDWSSDFYLILSLNSIILLQINFLFF